MALTARRQPRMGSVPWLRTSTSKVTVSPPRASIGLATDAYPTWLSRPARYSAMAW